MSYKVDDTQKIIIETFKKLGYSVISLAMIKDGCPDLLIAKNGENILVECKRKKGELNDLQIQFILKWNTAVYICRNADDCISLDAGLLMPYST